MTKLNEYIEGEVETLWDTEYMTGKQPKQRKRWWRR